MKIKDILGEEATMLVKDFKPGVSVSMVDPTTDTMTVVDLKKNPTALKMNDQGDFSFDPTPDMAAPGEPRQPELKPGAKVQVDTQTTEGFSDVDIDLRDIAQSGDEEKLIDAMDGLHGTEVQIALEDMMSNLADELAAKGMDNLIDDQDKMIELLMDKLVDEYSKDSGGDELEINNREGMAPGTALDVKNERMDESAVITALARRITGTEVKPKIKSQSVLDIKKLAGL
jgi:hypothetical protein